VPECDALRFIRGVLSRTTEADTGQGPILLYPFHPGRLTAPFSRAPEGHHAFLFALLRTAIPPSPEQVADLVAKNRAIYDRLVALGGKRYPIDSVPMSRADWRQHFGPVWDTFVHDKARFDPDNVLTPGQHIFS
jgi:FAD/FMN-containing dehydrogenase